MKFNNNNHHELSKVSKPFMIVNFSMNQTKAKAQQYASRLKDYTSINDNTVHSENFSTNTKTIKQTKAQSHNIEQELEVILPTKRELKRISFSNEDSESTTPLTKILRIEKDLHV